MSVKLPSFDENALWNNPLALLLRNADFRTFSQLIPRKTILPPNFRSFSNRISITRKHTEIHRNLHIPVTLTLFVRVRILLRLPTKAAFCMKSCFFHNFLQPFEFPDFSCLSFRAPILPKHDHMCPLWPHNCDAPAYRAVLSAGSAALSIKTPM